MAQDVSVYNHGSIIGFTLLTEDAQTWADEHIPDDAQWMGPTFFAEMRYANDIAEGMQSDGLVLV